MSKSTFALAAVAIVGASAQDVVPLVTFDGNPNTTFPWRQNNDPVMGGASVGNFTINREEGYGRMLGTVNDIPFLGLPGFIKAQAGESQGYRWNDARGTTHLQMKIRTMNPEYKGFRVCIGADIFPVFKCHKADFFLTGERWNIVSIPYEDFSRDWNDATGDPVTTCKENPDVCVTNEVLQNIAKFSIWGEGVNGDANLDLEWVRAVKLFDDDSIA